MSKFTFFIALPHSDTNVLADLSEELKGLEMEQRNDICHLKVPKYQEFTANKKIEITEETKGFYCFNMRKHQVRDNRGLVLGGTKSTAADGTWDIWVVSPKGFDLNGDGKIDYGEWKTGTSVFRKLSRFNGHIRNIKTMGSGSGSTILGPWSAKKLQQQFGDIVDCVLYPEVPDETTIVDGNPVIVSWKFLKSDGITIPWIYFGENSTELAKIDYSPTIEEITSDVEIKRDVLFPVSAIILPDKLILPIK